MSKLKVDNFYQFFVFVILIISHDKEKVDINIRKENTLIFSFYIALYLS